MPFPISHLNQLRFTDVDLRKRDIPDLILFIEARMREKGARKIYHKSNSLTFKGWQGDFANLYPIVPFATKGSLEISKEALSLTVNYQLFFSPIPLVLFVAPLLAFVLFVRPFNLEELLRSSLSIAFCYFLYFYVTKSRFERFLKKTLHSNVAG